MDYEKMRTFKENHMKKRWMKPVSLLLAILLLTTTLAACGSTTKLDQHPGQTQQTEETDKKPGDKEQSKKPGDKTDKKHKADKDAAQDKGDAQDKDDAQDDDSQRQESTSQKSDKPAKKPGKKPAKRPVSDGSQTGQDEFHTDPVPEGKPLPVEPGKNDVDTSSAKTCYLTINCHTILDNMDQLEEGKEVLVPADGVLFARHAVTFYEGESVFDVLQRTTRENGIHMSSRFTPMYNSAYIEGIGNLYEFDCGSLSGWMYEVNGWYPNYGVSRYMVAEGDEIIFNYTCDLGRDLGQTWPQG